MTNTYLLYPTTSTDLALVGGKARALAALVNADLPIPAWFVLSPEAFTVCPRNSGYAWRMPKIVVRRWPSSPTCAWSRRLKKR